MQHKRLSQGERPMPDTAGVPSHDLSIGAGTRNGVPGVVITVHEKDGCVVDEVWLPTAAATAFGCVLEQRARALFDATGGRSDA